MEYDLSFGPGRPGQCHCRPRNPSTNVASATPLRATFAAVAASSRPMRLRKQAMPGARVGGLGPCAVADCGYGGWFAGSRGRQRGAAFGVVARPWRDWRRLGWVVAVAPPAVAGALVSAGPARSWRFSPLGRGYPSRGPPPPPRDPPPPGPPPPAGAVPRRRPRPPPRPRQP